MTAYWVVLDNGTRGCIEADDETAAKAAAQSILCRTIKDIYTLPYPANPRLIMKKYNGRDGRQYEIPSFCHSPEKCKGKGSCPNDYACND